MLKTFWVLDSAVWIFSPTLNRIKVFKAATPPRMKRELRCKSETIPVAVSLLILGAFLMTTASVAGRSH